MTLTESTIVAQQVEYLRRAGWFVVVFAQDRAVRRQLAGWPDHVSFKYDTTLLVEAKTRTGRVRDSQERLKDNLLPHTGPHLWYVLARSLDALVEVVDMIEEGR